MNDGEPRVFTRSGPQPRLKQTRGNTQRSAHWGGGCIPHRKCAAGFTVRTRLLQCLRAAHQPRQRLGVPVEDLHRQVVVLLLLHDPLLQLLLVQRDIAVASVREPPPTPHRVDGRVLPVPREGRVCCYLAHDGQLQRQVLHLHKVFFI